MRAIALGLLVLSCASACARVPFGRTPEPMPAWAVLRAGSELALIPPSSCSPLWTRSDDRYFLDFMSEEVDRALSIRVGAGDQPGVLQMAERLVTCIADSEPRFGPRSIAYSGGGRVLQWRHMWIMPDHFTQAELAALPSRDSLAGLLTRLYGSPREVTERSTIWVRDSVRVVLLSASDNYWIPEIRIAHRARCAWLRQFLSDDAQAEWARSCA